ncbi:MULTISPECIES: hypothetical protein [unclassified Vibrio]|uniref:hypothetical protein n=1 Tax=unclassified Vibrio TaxID=2614977 RepID=UPI001361984E|nr:MULTISPECIES: hypothetical protein [unclassified Vibrio]NAW55924.1 hypothetical protein [Vibrio sp. V36_P2S2PM302]NAX24392.1 hypothetical protein [Vibrio sp. V38_P2S17PM301]NAX32123.1 hypothetical protein [Vibrio sp. V37_P2S8PM304]
MKKLAVACLTSVLLWGCSVHPVAWEQSNVATIANIAVSLKSTLWLNKMPTVEEETDQVLHGALYLSSDQSMPADLDAEALIIKQGDNTWQIDAKQLEVRTQSENRWEVVFAEPVGVNDRARVDVALRLSEGAKTQWLIEKNVKIDVVY